MLLLTLRWYNDPGFSSFVARPPASVLIITLSTKRHVRVSAAHLDLAQSAHFRDKTSLQELAHKQVLNRNRILYVFI